MPDITVVMKANPSEVEQYIKLFAIRFECSISEYEDGQLLLPPYMLRKHGLLFMPSADAWIVSREDDATTWEDYLLVLSAHELGEQFGGVIYYGNRKTPVEPDSAQFATFDQYVEFVLDVTPGILKETKKMWMYSHQKRSVR